MAEDLENKSDNSQSKTFWQILRRILCEIAFGLLLLIVGMTLLYLTWDLIEILRVWRTVFFVIINCLLMPILASMGVICGGKITKGKGNFPFTTLLSVIFSFLCVLVFLGRLYIELGLSLDKVGLSLSLEELYMDSTKLVVSPTNVNVFSLVGAVIGYECSDKLEKPKLLVKVGKVLCQIGFGFLGLIAGVALFFLICTLIEPLGELLLNVNDLRDATMVIGCCLLVPIFVSLGVLLGGKLSKEKGKFRFTILSSVILSSLGFLICYVWDWYYHKQYHYPSDVPGFEFFLFLLYLPLIILVFSFVGAIIGYEWSDKRERKRLEKSETS